MEDQKNVSSLSTPERLPLIGDFFEHGFGFLGKHWKKLLAYFLPLALIQVIIGYLSFHFFGTLEYPPVWVSIVTAIIGIAISYISICSADLYCRDLDNGAEVSPFRTYGRGFRYFWKMLWAGILALLVVSAGIALSYAAGMAFFALAGIASALIDNSIAVMLIKVFLAVVGVAFLAFCYLYFALSATFITYTVILEDRKGLQAVMQSFWYARGRKWGIFGRWFVVMLIPGFIALVFGAVGMGVLVSMYSFEGLENLSDATSDAYRTFFYMSLIASLIFTPLNNLFYSSFGYVLWKHAKLAAGSEEAQEAYRASSRRKFVAAAWAGFAIGILILALAILAPIAVARFFGKADSTPATEKVLGSEDAIEANE